MDDEMTPLANKNNHNYNHQQNATSELHTLSSIFVQGEQWKINNPKEIQPRVVRWILTSVRLITVVLQ